MWTIPLRPNFGEFYTESDGGIAVRQKQEFNSYASFTYKFMTGDLINVQPTSYGSGRTWKMYYTYETNPDFYRVVPAYGYNTFFKVPIIVEPDTTGSHDFAVKLDQSILRPDTVTTIDIVDSVDDIVVAWENNDLVIKSVTPSRTVKLKTFLTSHVYINENGIPMAGALYYNIGMGQPVMTYTQLTEADGVTPVTVTASEFSARYISTTGEIRKEMIYRSDISLRKIAALVHRNYY
jgi:hypothetical protein